MLPRHDIFFFIYEAYYKGQYDKAVLEFEVPKEAVDEFVWALVNKRVSDAIVNAKTVDNRALRNDLVSGGPSLVLEHVTQPFFACLADCGSPTYPRQLAQRQLPPPHRKLGNHRRGLWQLGVCRTSQVKHFRRGDESGSWRHLD